MNYSRHYLEKKMSMFDDLYDGEEPPMCDNCGNILIGNTGEKGWVCSKCEEKFCNSCIVQHRRMCKDDD